MLNPSYPTIYDTIGHGYCSKRIPDRRIETAIQEAIGECGSICNIGAGTGSYEPCELNVVAVEPSAKMIQQRINSNPVVQATAEELPFKDGEFDVAMAVLTIHHWNNLKLGLLEMSRVSRRQVIFTYDPACICEFWLLRDYFPKIIEPERQRSVPISAIEEILDVRSVEPVLIPWDCTDGFLAAYWRRPEYYINSEIRNSISTFAQMSSESISQGIDQLKSDLETGRWHENHTQLISQTEMDFGYRIIVAGESAE